MVHPSGNPPGGKGGPVGKAGTCLTGAGGSPAGGSPAGGRPAGGKPAGGKPAGGFAAGSGMSMD